MDSIVNNVKEYWNNSHFTKRVAMAGLILGSLLGGGSFIYNQLQKEIQDNPSLDLNALVTKIATEHNLDPANTQLLLNHIQYSPEGLFIDNVNLPKNMTAVSLTIIKPDGTPQTIVLSPAADLGNPGLAVSLDSSIAIAQMAQAPMHGSPQTNILETIKSGGRIQKIETRQESSRLVTATTNDLIEANPYSAPMLETLVSTTSKGLNDKIVTMNTDSRDLELPDSRAIVAHDESIEVIDSNGNKISSPLKGDSIVGEVCGPRLLTGENSN